MPTRIELRLAGSVEHYDDDGRLLETQAIQPVTVSAMSASALVDSIASLAGQLTAAAWPEAADEEGPDGR